MGFLGPGRHPRGSPEPLGEILHNSQPKPSHVDPVRCIFHDFVCFPHISRLCLVVLQAKNPLYLGPSNRLIRSSHNERDATHFRGYPGVSPGRPHTTLASLSDASGWGALWDPRGPTGRHFCKKCNFLWGFQFLRRTHRNGLGPQGPKESHGAPRAPWGPLGPQGRPLVLWGPRGP